METRKIKYLLHPNNNYAQIYDSLKDILPEQYMIFASPVYNQTETVINYWNYPTGTKEYSLDEITDEALKAKVANKLLTSKRKIESILSSTKLKDIVSLLFETPSDKDIKYIQAENKSYIVLTSWACLYEKNEYKKSTVETYIEKYVKNTQNVVIKLIYRDKTPVIDKEFYYFYEDFEERVYSNFEGKKSLGAWLIGAIFKVYDKKEGEKIFVHDIEVIKGKEVYEVVFILYVKATLTVKNQKDEIYANRKILIKYRDTEKEYITDENGIIELSELEAEEELFVKDFEKQNISETYEITKEENAFEFIIFRPIPTTSTIVVIDEETNEEQTNYPVLIKYEGDEKERNTGEKAIIEIENLVVGKDIKISDKYNKENFQIHELKEHRNDYILKIPISKSNSLKIKVIEHRYFIPFIWGRKKNLENIVVDFINNKGEKITRTTDENGYCTDLPEDEFDNNQKVKALIHLIKTNRKGKEKEKIVTRTFVLKKEQ